MELGTRIHGGADVLVRRIAYFPGEGFRVFFGQTANHSFVIDPKKDYASCRVRKRNEFSGEFRHAYRAALELRNAVFPLRQTLPDFGFVHFALPFR